MAGFTPGETVFFVRFRDRIPHFCLIGDALAVTHVGHPGGTGVFPFHVYFAVEHDLAGGLGAGDVRHIGNLEPGGFSSKNGNFTEDELFGEVFRTNSEILFFAPAIGWMVPGLKSGTAEAEGLSPHPVIATIEIAASAPAL